MSIVIVALPEADSPVYKISTEKKPHMTLLFLGDGPLENEEATVQYIQHVAETSLHTFGMSKDRRGILGPDDADVIFFREGWESKDLKNARAFLLDNEDIAKAHSNAEQFEGWIPHLTLGYPTAPAKPLENQWELSYITFDRIAIWFGDSEGPEFQLNNDNDFATPSLMYQSAINNLAGDILAHVDLDNLSEEELAHFGRLGMKWGVRHPVDSSGHVKGFPTGGHKTASDSEAKKALAKLAKGKASPDHKKFVKNLDKNVSHLSTAEIRDLTARIQAIKSLKAETAAQKAAKKSMTSKLVGFALNSVKEGAKQATDKYIKELTGGHVTEALQGFKQTKAHQEKMSKERQKAEAHDLKMRAQAEKDAKEASKNSSKDDSSSTSPERTLALETLAAQIARQNG